MQIVLDVVRHGYLKISNFNLIVFDECHHAQKEHPMLMLMAKFKDLPESEHPRVIGLTGMLTAPSIKPQNVITDLNRLESTFRGVIATAKGASFQDVLMHSTSPDEKVIYYEKYLNLDDAISRKIEKMKEMINGWSLDPTHETRDRYNDKQPKIQTKFESICKDYEYQINTLGKQIEEFLYHKEHLLMAKLLYE